MKTPYDPVVRLGRRETEAMRLALRAEMDRIAELADAAGVLAERVRRECDVAAMDWTISTHDWVRARHAQAEEIERRRADAETELTRLRALAREAYGRLRAAERATATWIDKAREQEQRKEQAEADDLSSARRLLTLRRKSKWQAGRKHDARG